MDPEVRLELDLLRQRVEALEARAFGAAAPAAGGDDEHTVELIRGGRKIEAIKRHRELTGLGLAEAKDAVEEIERRMGL
jgi:ribosomal protein L7/L12